MSENTIELTDDNFDTKTAKGNWVIDFWAEWCVAPNSHIYTSPLNSLPACSVSKNNNIVSFNDGIAKDNVTYSKTTNMGGHCKKVVTSSGRSLETTDDHAFFTKRGWIAAQDLTKRDKIAVLPVTDPVEFVGEESVLLDEKDFEFLRTDYKNLDKYIEELKEKGLLPLKKDDSKLLILSRLVGALFSDGSLYNGKNNNYREISFALGQEKDVNDIINDLNKLDFGIIHTSERTNECKIGERKFSIHTFKVKCLSTSLYLLFRVLGVPEGNKTNQKYAVPNWIKNGETAVKKEFLSAYLGGDGPRVTINMCSRKDKKPFNSVGINDIEFRKRMDLVESGIDLANEIVDLLRDFNVDVSNVFYEIDSYMGKDKTQTAIIHIPLARNFQNGFIISQNIGYAYCWQKQLISMYSGEFIREILSRRKLWMETYEKVMKLHKEGVNCNKISEDLGVDNSTVYQWTQKGNKPTIKKHYLKFDLWLKESTDGLKDGFVWEKVEDVQNVHLPEVQVIETEKHHNFVANGFLVHNCGPCRMMAPHFEKAAAKMKGKVNFGKVDVEANQELASRFEVMSIPTTLFLKNKEQVNRISGALPEEEILGLVDESF